MMIATENTENTENFKDDLTRKIISSAIEVQQVRKLNIY